jgi:ATP-dependent exoDNAse (exonuclease V) alpha subunit
MLAAAVTSWQRAGISVFGVGPSATAARQLRDGAGTVADTLHKLVYEHSAKQTAGRGPADAMWDLPARSVVIIDESGMVDTRLLHDYARIAQAKQWRTVLVGDHRQLDAVDAGGMFAELVGDPDVVTVELDTLHRFHHDWEADASLLLRNGDHTALDAYDSHGRIHGHLDHAAAVDAVADAAYVGLVGGRDVLVMAPTNAVVDELNATLTDRLLAVGRLDAADRIDIAGCVFYPGQHVVTRANNRTLTHGAGEWVRNGDRWTVHAGTRDELYLTNTATGDRLALPAEYIAAGNLTVNYASTVHRAQGATVDEAHVIINDRTNNRQLYVAATRGRRANHIHTAPPAFDPDQHGPASDHEDWLPRDAVAAALNRQPDATSAIARRRQLRDLVNGAVGRTRGDKGNDGEGPVPTNIPSSRAAEAAERLRRLTNERRGQSLSR